MSKISVIIPIYNAEDFLSKSVESVLNQTLKDIELLLIDDGSTDNSGKICDEYALKDKRVKVYHQENSGVSAARNNGIKLAKGEYIAFVDSDDYINPDMLEKMYQKAIEAGSDIVMCDAVTVYDNNTKEPDTITQISKSRLLKHASFTPNLLLEMAGSVWRCIYKKSLIIDNNITFPIGLKFSEDRIFNIYAFGFAKSVYYMKKAFYNRYINLKSAVHSFHSDYFEMQKKARLETQKAIELAWENNEALKDAYLSQFIGGALMAINNYHYKTSPLSSKERRIAVKKLCQDELLRSSIIKVGIKSRLEKWILNSNINLLILRAKLANFKNKR